MTDYFWSTKPAYPWSLSPVGLPALAAVALMLVALTVWTYLGQPKVGRGRLAVILLLRLTALLVALVTAVRPSIAVQEEPKVPSVLLIGIDTSESMTVKDEVGGQARFEAVRRVLERCQPILDQLATEHGVGVQLYRFSTPDFDPATGVYTLESPSDGKRSDYGTYLNKTFERWQSERYVRGHLIIGDGCDNGEAYSAVAEAARWGRRNVPISTFTVGTEAAGQGAQDIQVVAVECDPAPAPVKTEVTVVGTVHAFGFAGTRAVARVSFDGLTQVTEEVTLEREKDNKVRLTVKAPAAKGEVKVRLAVGQLQDDRIVPLRGEVNAENNASDTYLTVTKDGARVLIIDRLRFEQTRIRDVLRSEKRFDLHEVIRQSDGELSASAEELLDLDAQAYDVVIIGNVSPEQLTFRRGGKVVTVLDKVREHVERKGLGLLFLGGEHALRGLPSELLPVTVPADPKLAIVENVDRGTGRPIDWYQIVPTEDALGSMLRLSRDPNVTKDGWALLNEFKRFARLTGYNKMVAKPGSRVLAWVSPDPRVIPAGTRMPDKGADPLLVSWQIGDGARGRVAVFGAFDTYLWEKLGQPRPLPEGSAVRNGSEIHSRVWKQLVLWLAHQEEEEGQAYARPLLRQLKVGGEQTVRVGVKLPSGGDDPSAELLVKIVPLPEGKAEPDPAEVAKARPETVITDKSGAKVLFRPRTKGEYFVVLTSPKKDADGRPELEPDGTPKLLRATAKFIVLPETSEEMLKVSADHEFLSRLSLPTGGKALRLEDLPGFLKDLTSLPMDTVKPKPRFYPDWRRNHSHGFLPAWLVLFAVLLGTEWALRRLWGLA